MADRAAPDLKHLLAEMGRQEASDLHLVCGYRPMFRVHGELKPAADTCLDLGAIQKMLGGIVPASARPRLDSDTDLDFAIQIESNGAAPRFRVNVFADRGGRGACFRAIPQHIPTLNELGFSPDLGER